MDSIIEDVRSDRHSMDHDNDDNDGEDEDDLEDYDEEPFDCYDPVAAEAAVHKYLPWKKNNNHPSSSPSSTNTSPMALRRSPPSSPSSSPASPSSTNNPSRRVEKKSRPWRVDVMLKTTTTTTTTASTSATSSPLSMNHHSKGAGMLGVERSSVSWKQQMKERKQVYDASGVTVTEEDDDLFDGILPPTSSSPWQHEDHDSNHEEGGGGVDHEDEDDRSQRATIGHIPSSPGTTFLQRLEEDPEEPRQKDTRAQEDANADTARSGRTTATSPATAAAAPTSTTAAAITLASQHGATESSMSARNPVTSICQDLQRAIQTLEEKKDEDEEQMHPSRSLQNRTSSYEQTGDSPLRPRQPKSPRSMGSVGGSTSGVDGKTTPMAHTEEAPSTQAQQQQQEDLASKPIFTDLHSALEQYKLPSISRRSAWMSDEDSDDCISVGSIRSIASAHYNHDTQKAEKQLVELHRRRLIQNLEATFVPMDEKSYTITALGQAHPRSTTNHRKKKDPLKNEYFVAYARFQRSRFVNELKSATCLIPTKHFDCVEKTRQDWEREATEWKAKQEFVQTGNAAKLLAVLSVGDPSTTTDNDNNNDDDGADVSQPSPPPPESILSSSATSLPPAASTTQRHHSPNRIEVETVLSMESSAMASPLTSPDAAATTVALTAPGTVATSPHHPIEVETVMSIDTASTAYPSPVKVPMDSESAMWRSSEPPSSSSSSLLVNTVLTMDDSVPPMFMSPLSEMGAVTPLNVHVIEKETPDDGMKETAMTPTSPFVAPVVTESGPTSPATHVSMQESVVADLCDPVSFPNSPEACRINQNATTTSADHNDAHNEVTATTTTPTKEPSTTVTSPPPEPSHDSTKDMTPIIATTSPHEEVQPTAVDGPVPTSDATETVPPPTTAAVPPPNATTSSDPTTMMEVDATPPDSIEPPLVVSATQDSPKKSSKASKWRDRLAKRKSSNKKDLELPMNVPLEPAEVATAAPSTTPKNTQSNTGITTPSSNGNNDAAESPKEVKKVIENTRTELLVNEEDIRSASPIAEDEVARMEESSPDKARRKSVQWKQRLADRKKKTGPDEHPPEPNKGGKNDEPNHSMDIPLLPMSDHSPSGVADSKRSIPASHEKAEVDRKPNVEATATAATPTVALQSDLKNSFMAFDAMLQQRHGNKEILAARDADEYSEYTIEETVIHPEHQPTSAQVPRKSSDDMYEEITVDQSYMEFTVYESNDAITPFNSRHGGHQRPPTTPVHAAPVHSNTQNRMFSTPQVAREPIITLYGQMDDDEMTQLTFDQSYAGHPHEAEAPMPVPTSIVKEKKRSTENSSAKGSSSGRGSVKETIGDLHRSDSSAHSNSRKLGSSHSRRSGGSRGGVSATSSEKDSKRIAELLRKDIWSRDAKVVEEALDSIVAESAKGSKNRAKISQCGGIMGIIRAMESHQSVEAVQAVGCKALHRMAMDANTQVIIGEMGGIATILDAMTTFPRNIEVHKEACAALASITRHRGTTDEAKGVVPVLCASMTQHPKNMHIQSKAFGTIANLCMDNKNRLSELSESGGMLAMTMALQQPWPSKKEKHDAISNLSILLRCLAEHEEGDNGEEEDGYDDKHDDDLDELMSVVSQLEEEMSLHPDDNEDDGYYHDDDYGQDEGLGGYNTEPIHGQGFGQVETLEKIGRKEVDESLEETLDATLATAREGDDENCIIS